MEKILLNAGTGGYRTLKKAFGMKPDEITAEVRLSNLRGRGGAGFPTGLKWSFIPKADPKPRYLVCNADESEPGTFKDRELILKNPRLLIEGLIIASYAIGARQCYIYIRGEFEKEAALLEACVKEAAEKGFLGVNILGSGFDLEIIVHRGAGAYICGEETALLESIEGKRGLPRLKPPFPAVVGLFGRPTVINNVETLASVPAIIEKGGAWYSKLGAGKSAGTKLLSVSGPVKKPGVYEIELGLPFKKFLEEQCGGMLDGSRLKAVIPGGSSVPVLTAAEALRMNLDYESVQQAGSMLGSGGIIIIDDKACMVGSLLVLAKFYHHESCGQCTPCREGGGWIEKSLVKLEAGKGAQSDIGLIYSLAENILSKTLCPLGDALAMPVMSFITKFRPEFEAHARGEICGKNKMS
ncbi:MAG: NADH-quinone oxidoreductase subunit NuoF [Elusimicrobiales bacterium]|jgi:NADH-quinone oxidoreductase subunit F